MKNLAAIYESSANRTSKITRRLSDRKKNVGRVANRVLYRSHNIKDRYKKEIRGEANMTIDEICQRRCSASVANADDHAMQ